MTSTPFPLPAKLSPTLKRVFSYWSGLKRGGNDIPFWDDVTLSALPDIGEKLWLVDVFAHPERFRFNSAVNASALTGAVAGKFSDEVEMRGPLRFLRAQCSAAVEGRGPTFYRHEDTDAGSAFGRLVLPLWGDGRVSMLLCAVDEGA